MSESPTKCAVCSSPLEPGGSFCIACGYVPEPGTVVAALPTGVLVDQETWRVRLEHGPPAGLIMEGGPQMNAASGESLARSAISFLRSVCVETMAGPALRAAR